MDSYFNYIQVNVYTTGANGIFGLGERAFKESFYYKDGVYSMWARDLGYTPYEDGKSPGNNLYSTHPFYMYKHKDDVWVGAVYKLAHA